MTQLDAQQFGRWQVLKATAVALMIPFFISLYEETKGDFSNGILFFIQDYLNIYVLLMLAILFGLTFLFGGKAGKEIIIDKKNFLAITVKYAVTITLAIIVYAAAIGMIKNTDSSYNDFIKRLTHYLLEPLIKTAPISLIPILIVWLWATNKMRLKINADQE